MIHGHKAAILKLLRTDLSAGYDTWARRHLFLSWLLSFGSIFLPFAVLTAMGRHHENPAQLLRDRGVYLAAFALLTALAASGHLLLRAQRKAFDTINSADAVGVKRRSEGS